jgi:transcriptional regulator with XRE-family HTH domain
MIAALSKRLFNRLLRKPYRDAYVSEHVRTGIAYQVRALRGQRGWSQKKLSEEMGKPQSVVSRLEDPDYGKLSVQTLLEVASAFDVALVVRYVSFPNFIRQTRDVSPESMWADSFAEGQFRPVDDLPITRIARSSTSVVVGRYGGAVAQFEIASLRATATVPITAAALN